MAAAHDSFSVATAGTGNLTGTSSPGGTTKGVRISIIQNSGATDEIAGVDPVDYGGVKLKRVAFRPHTSGTEDGALYEYFLGSGIPTGAQTWTVTVSGGSVKQATCYLVTESGGDDTIIEDVVGKDSAAAANPTVTLKTRTGRSCVIYGALHSGQQQPTGVDGGTGYTTDQEHDYGSQVTSWIHRTSNSTGGDVVVDWVASAEEHGILAVAITADDVADASQSFREHFGGASLPANFTAITAASGTVTVSDSKAIVASPASGDVAAFYYTQPLDPRVSRTIKILLDKEVAGSQTACVWLLSYPDAPVSDTFGNLLERALLRMNFASTGTPRVGIWRYWSSTHGTTLEYNGVSGNVWTTPSVTALTPCPEQEYFELRLEVDGTGERSGGSGGWRIVLVSKPQTGTTWTDNQGMMLQVEATPWVLWTSSKFTNNLWLVIGNPATDNDGGTTHVEYIEDACDALVHSWDNERNQGGTWRIGHQTGFRGGLGPFSAKGQGADIALPVGGAGTWDELHVARPWVIDNTAVDGKFYLYYDGSSSSTGTQIGVASATSEYGPWTKDASNPIIARSVGTSRNTVAFPRVYYDPDEPTAGKRYKMVYQGADTSSPVIFRVFYAYAANANGPYTLYDAGGGANASPVLDAGTSGSYDEEGHAGPSLVHHEGRWWLFTDADNSTGTGGGIHVSKAPIGDDEPISFTKTGVVIPHHPDGPIDVLTADLNGPNVDIADTTGYVQDDVIVAIDNTSSSEQNTKYSLSRVRKVVSGTGLELYHSLRGFTTANGAAVRRLGGWYFSMNGFRWLEGKWRMFITPYQPFVDDATYGCYLESCAVLEADDLDGPWTVMRMQSPTLYLGLTANLQRHSMENQTLVEPPVTRSAGSLLSQVTEPASVRIALASEVTDTASARISVAGEASETASARISVAGQFTRDASARIGVAGETTVTASAQLSLAGDFTETASARISIASETIETASARVSLASEVTETASAQLSLAGDVIVQASARITTANTFGQVTETASALLAIFGESTEAASARIAVAGEAQETASARISPAGETTDTASALVAVQSTVQETASARLSIAGGVVETASAQLSLAGVATALASARIATATIGGQVTETASVRLVVHGLSLEAASVQLAVHSEVTETASALVVVYGQLTEAASARVSLAGDITEAASAVLSLASAVTVDASVRIALTAPEYSYTVTDHSGPRYTMTDHSGPRYTLTDRSQ